MGGQDLVLNSHAEDATRLNGACNPSDGDEVEEGGGDVIALCVDVATFFATFQK